MIPRVILNKYTEHPLKSKIRNAGLKQFDLAISVGIHQSQLSRQLRGIDNMPSIVENEITSILDSIKKPKRKKPKPIRKRAQKMEKTNVEDKNLSTFKRPKSKVKLPPKTAKKPKVQKK